MKTIYQLYAQGFYKSFEDRASIRSKRVFTSRQVAEEYVSEFIEKITGDGLYDLKREGLKVDILELELYE